MSAVMRCIETCEMMPIWNCDHSSARAFSSTWNLASRVRRACSSARNSMTLFSSETLVPRYRERGAVLVAVACQEGEHVGLPPFDCRGEAFRVVKFVVNLEQPPPNSNAQVRGLSFRHYLGDDWAVVLFIVQYKTWVARSELNNRNVIPMAATLPFAGIDYH